MNNKSNLEKNLPKFLENDIKALKQGIIDKVSYVDCLINEVQGSANSAWVDGIITDEQLHYIFDKYVYGKESEMLNDD